MYVHAQKARIVAIVFNCGKGRVYQAQMEAVTEKCDTLWHSHIYPYWPFFGHYHLHTLLDIYLTVETTRT